MQLQPILDWGGPGSLGVLPSDGGKAPVLLTHGTFSTAETCLPLAQFLGAAGHHVYVIEWRGRRDASGVFDFHDLAEGEIAGAIQALPAPAHLVAHSGGGLAMVFAALDPDLRRHMRSLTLIATQGTHLRATGPLPYLGIRALELWGRMRGYWPARLLKLGPVNESGALLSQWVHFNRARRIADRDGADIFPRLAALNLPEDLCATS